MILSIASEKWNNHTDKLISKDVKHLPVQKQVTSFQNEQPVIKKFQTLRYAFVYWQFWYYDMWVIHSLITQVNDHICATAIP